jgi:hypothetical protein
MTTNYTMKPMKLDTRALMHPEPAALSPADFQAWLANPLTKALKKSQMEQNEADEALLRQALDCLVESVDLVRHDYEGNWRHGVPTRERQLAGMNEQLDQHEATITAIKERLDGIR